MIDLKEVVKIYQTSGEELIALKHVSLHICKRRNHFYNGTQRFREINDDEYLSLLYRFDGGMYHLNGQDVTNLTDNESSHVRNP